MKDPALWVIIFLVILGLVIGIRYFGVQLPFPSFLFSSSVSSTTPSAIPKTTPKTTVTKSTSTTAPSKTQTLTYDKALNLYSNERIQFDALCRANPSSLNARSGFNVMFDNRSGGTLSIFVDGTKYSLAAFGFKIVKLSHATLPYTVHIDCGTGKNTAQILLQ